jgi:hypothetical protein
MTLAAVWRVGERLLAIADTRISRSPGNVLTEHGPKILPITLLCKQPGPSGFYDRIAYATTFGFAYAGATLPALSTHALTNTLFQNLAGSTGSAPPALAELSVAIGEISLRYMREIGELSGPHALFSAIVFGFCTRTNRFRAFQIIPQISSGSLQIHLSEHDLYGPDPLLVIGNRPELLRERVLRDRPALYANPDHSIDPAMQAMREIDLPRRALAALIAEGADETIGGATQEAWVTRAGFEPISKMVPILPRPESGPNATSKVLGFDMHDFNTIGSYFFSLTARG